MMEKKYPIIGVNTNLETEAGAPITRLLSAYWEAVVTAGGLPVLMPQLQDPGMIGAFLDRVDAFLMIGGDDVSGRRQGVDLPATAVVLDPRREETDFILLAQLLQRRLPTLAICLACQQLNLLRGGTLYQDLPLDGPPALIRHYARSGGAGPTHAITLDEASTLSRIWNGAAAAVVNSFHHQAIRRLGAGLRRVAWAPDGLTEAIEVEGLPFFLGVQWHPERLPAEDRQRKLFAALVRQALK